MTHFCLGILETVVDCLLQGTDLGPEVEKLVANLKYESKAGSQLGLIIRHIINYILDNSLKR